MLLPDALESFDTLRRIVGVLAAHLLTLDSIEAMWVGMGSMSALGNLLRRRRGRPRKFDVPSRAVTLTLPESTLAELAKIAPDPGRAIVQLLKRKAPVSARPAAELVSFGRRAVISIRPTPTLSDRAGVELVPLPDGRALISFDQPTTAAELELAIYDALEDPKLPADDRRVFEEIASILRKARRADDVRLLRRNILVLESSGSGSRTARKSRKTH